MPSAPINTIGVHRERSAPRNVLELVVRELSSQVACAAASR